MEVPELIDYPIDLRTVYDDPSILTTQLRKLARSRGEQTADTELTFLLGYLYYATGDPQGCRQREERRRVLRPPETNIGFRSTSWVLR